MHIIINGFHAKEQIELINEIIELSKVDNCIVIMSELDGMSFNENTEVLIVKDIIKGNYCNYDEDLVFDKRFVEYIHSNLYTLLSMMTRFYVYEKYEMGFEEKKAIIYKHFLYWYNFFNKNSVKYYISSNIPHDIYDYIILLVAKYYNRTKVIYFFQSQFKKIIIPMQDYIQQNIKIKELYDKRLNNHIELCEIAKLEWDSQLRKETPFYMKKKKNFIHIIIQKLRFSDFDIKYVHVFSYMINNYIRKRELKAYSNKPDLKRKYIYFPLHYQPELTSCPLGGVFNDQYIAIRMIDKLLPPNVLLYVKEHPKQKFANRRFRYYSDLIINSKNTHLIDSSANSRELIENSIAVATITGTAGWEALFCKKPVLLFGNVYYQYAPGVYNVNDKKELQNYLDIILNDNFLYNERNLKLFLNCIVEASIIGTIDSVYMDENQISFDDSKKNILNYLQKEFFHG